MLYATECGEYFVKYVMKLNNVMQTIVQGLKNAQNNDNNQLKSLNTQNSLHISTTWITPDPNPN
jgi:hypothetical protein